ncbi:MAG: GntR family transcriptional regulator [Maritimibacter sp.]|nr:GntR family transcriptional regulator [Maritimibacter sp.]
MPDPVALPQLDIVARPSVADQVFEELRRQVLTLELAPGTKISEVEVAKAMGVSRQPVRDAFYRLSKLGFLLIRPQRATTVTLISSAAVMQARFIRMALELETVRVAATRLGEEDFAALQEILDRQHGAVKAADRSRFHRLDDLFHHEICARAGLGFAWDLISENKGHMDRVRLLTLSFALDDAYGDHLRIFEALKANDPDRSAETMRAHLTRIVQQIERTRDANHAWFADED